MIRNTLEALRHLIWPSRCASCDILLDMPEAFLCDECRKAIRFAGLRDVPESLDAAFAFFYYDGAIQSMISRWKYHEDYCARLAVLSCVSEEISKAAPLLTAPLSIVPVPPHPRRLQERGFDPVWTFSSKLATLLSQATNTEIKLCDECLHRAKHTVHQAGLSAEERATNLQGAFETTDQVPERVILVDDVMTTGATLSACAKTLRNAGTNYIFGMTLAYTSAGQN